MDNVLFSGRVPEMIILYLWILIKQIGSFSSKNRINDELFGIIPWEMHYLRVMRLK